MTREDILENIKEVGVKMKKEIPVKKYKRTRIVQEEIVEAFQTPVPNAIIVKSRPRQVEKDNWIVIHSDGTQSAYNDEEFKKVFEVIGLGQTFGGTKDEQVTANK